MIPDIWLVISVIDINCVSRVGVSIASLFYRVCSKNGISISAIYQLFTDNGVMLLWLSLKGVHKKENTFHGRS